MNPHQLAAETYKKYPNYAQKLIHSYPAPLVEMGKDHPGDLPGLWYEALYATAVKYPKAIVDEPLYLVSSYRMMITILKELNSKGKACPTDWPNASYGKKTKNKSESFNENPEPGYLYTENDLNLPKRKGLKRVCLQSEYGMYTEYLNGLLLDNDEDREDQGI